MIEENMAKSYNETNFKETEDIKGNTKLKELLSLPIEEFAQVINEQKSLIEKTDGRLGLTLLFLSVQNQLDQQAKILLDKGANPNKQNRYGETTLHLAIEKLNHKIVNLLLEKQANPNIQQEYGETAMHFAARKGDYKVLKLLLLYKGDPTIRANDGSLPIDFANEYCNDKCIQILELEQKKQQNKQISSRKVQEEAKANGLTNNSTNKFEPKSKTNDFARKVEEYDYMQYPSDQLTKKHQYGSKSFNVNKLIKFGDTNIVSSNNIKENGINSINLRKSMIIIDPINPLTNRRYNNNNKESIQTPKHYQPIPQQDNFDYFSIQPQIIIHSKKNDIKKNNVYQRGNTLRPSLTKNVLKNSVRLTKSFFEETINARDSNPFIDNSNNPIFSQGREDLYNMLKTINMEKYIDLLINEGFDDLRLLIQETQYINDSHLKLIGISQTGHRAKILIKIESESKRLALKLNNEAVFYSGNDPTNYTSDSHLYSVYHWLKNNKLEEYYNKFYDMGYHSIELLYIQMATSNPLTDDLLKSDLHIEKLGHRIRLINQLNEDSQIYVNKLKINDGTNFEKAIQKKDSCTCVIY